MIETFGRYQLKQKLGQGGMATVYLAHDPRFGRDVALKVMAQPYQDDSMFRSRFEREAKTIATLEHPAIVPVYDFGEDNNQLYLVMRYMPGGSLADRLIRGPLQLAEAVAIIHRIGDALDHAHLKGVIHRDLKPGNILFDQYANPFLSDFGIVKLAEATSNLTGSGVVGTPAYMSPEQVHGEKEIDGRSDIYTLGIILFEMLTGRKPYRADTPVKLMMAHLMNPVPSILDVKPDLPVGCETVIQKVLAKEPNTRYSTAQEMTAALTATLTGFYPTPTFYPQQTPTTPQVGVVAHTFAEQATATQSLNLAPEAVKPFMGDPTVAHSPSARASTADDPTWMKTKPPVTPPAKGWHWLWSVVGGAGLTAFLLLGLWFLLSSNNPLVFGTTTNMPEATASASESPTFVTAVAVLATSENTPMPSPPTKAPATATTTPSPTPTLLQIGTSAGGKPLTAVRFGTGPNVLIFVGGMHAGYAPASVEVANNSIAYFSQNPQEIPPTITLYIIASLNPDSEPQAGELEGRLNDHGIDLNRNWDCRWQPDTLWLGQIQRGMGGKKPFSEPETLALSNFIIAQKAVAVIFWEAKASNGLVSAGSCSDKTLVSLNLSRIYGAASGYDVADFEGLTHQVINGDATNWLDQHGIPAIAVLLPDWTEADWENNLAGIRAVLFSFQ